MKVLYEDNHLLIVDKPAGLLTQPSGTLHDSLESHCKQWLKAKHNKPGNVYLHAVHRLDKPVSGIVVFAKTSKALTRVNAAIKSKQVKKWYVAWVESPLVPPEGILEHSLVHDEFHATVEEEGAGKKALLHYRTLEKKGTGALIEVELKTGRYHQIRAQLAAAGSPIVGDDKYGAKSFYKTEAIALHHCRFEMVHPVTLEHLLIESKASFISDC